MSPLFKTLLGLLATSSVVFSHGAPETPEQALFRRSHEEKVKRAFGKCSAANKLARRDVQDVRVAKREAAIDEHLSNMGLSYLQPRDFLNTGGDNSSCVLTPESEEGPYYVNGSLIRHDVRENEPGIPLLLDVQVTDVRTCEPLKDLMIDFWGANSTGVYSGVSSEDTVGQTQLRGIRKTDEYGLVQLLTIVPGWYAGRAQHVHVKAHVNYTTYPNNTISFGSIPHTGQLFFQQSSLSAINEIYPYTQDSNTFTLNSADRVFTDQANTSYYDPLVEMRSMGYNLTAGMIGFVNIAIDPTSTPADAGASAGGGGAMPSGSGGVPSATPSA